MNLKTQRNILGVAVVVLLIVLGVMVGTGGLTGAAGAETVKFDTASGQWVITSDTSMTVNPLSPGQSVVGQDTFITGLNIHRSGGDDGNDVKYVVDLNKDGSAYGANKTINGKYVENVVNACAIPGGGLADVGAADKGYAWDSKKHDYMFTFTPGKTVSRFSIGVVDWGDFLQYQAAQAPGESGTHTIQMFGYDESGAVVATTEYTFHTDAQTGGIGKPPTYLRPSTEFPNYTPSLNVGLEKFGLGLKRAGDACEAQLGQPGKLILTVTGTGITRIEVKFKDERSMDPHMALWLGGLEIEFEAQDCYNFLALSTEGRKSFDFSGTASVKFCGGGVWSNSGAESSNNSVPTYDESCDQPLFTSSGEWIKPENLTNAGYTLSSQEQAPLADPILAKGYVPTNPGNCQNAIDVKKGQEISININGPTCYKNISVSPDGFLRLTGTGTDNNVLYIANGSGAPAKIEGRIEFHNIFMYTEGDLHVNSQSNSLWEPMLTNGPLHGFLLWVNGKQFTVNGGSNSFWIGTIYAPNAAVKFNGGSDTILKTTLVAKTIDFEGNNNTLTYCVPELNYVRIP